MKKITLIVLLLLSIFSFGQTATVTVTDLKVKNLVATTVNFGTNVTSVNVSITASVSSNYNTSQGSIMVYYKRNSSTSTSPIIPTNGYDGNFFLPNGLTGTKTFTITLSRSEFDNTGGVVYVEYHPSTSDILAYKSSNINVTKIPDPISNNIISGNQTIYEGQSVSAISGNIPLGGDGTFIYSWQQKVGNGSWTNISGSNNNNYSPANLTSTTLYRRIVASSGVSNSTSNEVTITVSPAPIVQNNTITIDGVIVSGSLPTGGLGTNSYMYTWYVIDEDGDASELSDSSQSLILTEPTFTRYFNSPNNFTLKRMVTSGSQYVPSNGVTIPHISEIQNNIISINGYNVTGTIPTGGMGNYSYSWAIYYSGDAIVFDETTKDLDLTPHINQINGVLQIDSSAKLVRVVKAGISSTSNQLSLNNITTTALKNDNALTSAVYPNPTSGTINFTTDFSSNKEIEIIVHSQELGNSNSVFKGTATPNQIVKWDIPSNYPKGIYYYKILSDNKEIKSGKILYQ